MRYLFVAAICLGLSACGVVDSIRDNDGVEGDGKDAADSQAAAATPTTNFEVDLVAEGEAIANSWCRSCHVTSADGAGADVGPTWVEIANNPEKTDFYLRAFLSNPHGQMEWISLTREQIREVIAYIRSLET